MKIHQLCILKGTALEVDYLNGDLGAIEFTDDEYIELLADFISRIPENVIIQRVMAEAKTGELVAPLWADRGKKNAFLDKFHAHLEKFNISQGDKYKIKKFSNA